MDRAPVHTANATQAAMSEAMDEVRGALVGKSQ